MSIPHFWLSLLLQSLLRGAAWLLLLLLITPMLRRVSAAGRAVVWKTGFVGLILLPMLLLLLPPLPLLQAEQPVAAPATTSLPPVTSLTAAPAIPTVPTQPAPSVAGGPSAALDRKSASSDTPSTAVVPSSRNSASSPLSPLNTTHASYALVGLQLLLLVWSLGVIVLLVRLAAGLWALRRLGQGATEPSATHIEIAEACGGQLGLQRPFRLRIAAPDKRLYAPITWGIWRPVVLLPSGYVQESPARWQAALLHEAAHIRRCDWAWLLLVRGLCAFYWCVPFIWPAARRLTLEMELACDDCVLAAGVSASDYATQILEVVRKMQTENVKPYPQAMPMARPPLAEIRIRAILDTTRSRRPSSRTLMILAALLPTLCLPVLSLRAVAASKLPSGSPSPILSPTTPAFSLPDAQTAFTSEPQEATSLPLHKSAAHPSLPVRPMSARIADLPTPFTSPTPATAEGRPDLPAPLRSAPPETNRSATAIVWGPVVNGLQSGLRIDRGKTAFAPNELIWQEVYLRNQSKEPVTIQSYVGYEQQGDPRVIDGQGNTLPALRFFGEGFAILSAQTVRPGEIARVGRVTLLFESPDPEAARELAPGLSARAENSPYVLAKPGRYTLAQTLSPLDLQGKPLPFTVHTGAIPIQIEDVPAAPTIFLDRNRIPDLNTSPIAWGPVRSGLQVGLFLLGTKEEFFSGERVRMAVVLRNVSKAPIRFRHQASFAFLESPQVTDARGKRREVATVPEPEWKPIGAIRMTGVTFDLTYAPSADGPSSLRETEIAPGQAVLGYSLTSFEVPAHWQDHSALPGRYLLKQPFRIGLGKGDGLDTLLETGALPVTFADPDALPERSNRL